MSALIMTAVNVVFINECIDSALLTGMESNLNLPDIEVLMYARNDITKASRKIYSW